MKKNMGTTDRIVRTILAIVMAALYFTGTVSGTLGVVMLILAIVFIATSIMGFCPLYLPLGLNTSKS